MKARYFVLGLLAGIVATILVVVAFMALMAMRPVSLVTTTGSGSSGDVVISISEEYLATVATSLAREEEPMVRQVAVDVQPQGRVDMVVTTQVSILGMRTDINVQLLSLVQVADTRIEFSVERIGVAGFGIPVEALPASLRSAFTKMEKAANQESNRVLSQAGLVPASLISDESGLTVALRAR